MNEECFGTCGLDRLQPALIVVRGQRVCSFRLSLGNGTFPIPVDNWDFGHDGPRTFRITFESGWPGPKTIKAEGFTNCLGKATTVHHVFTHAGSSQEDWRVGLNQPTQLCYSVPAPAPLPPLRLHTKVHITAPTSPKVSFGCTFGCSYDPDGKPGGAAGGNFPFPGLRAYSLVVSVGNQEVQAGTDTTFVTTQGGELLLCVNDDWLYDNAGGWQVNIAIDESLTP